MTGLDYALVSLVLFVYGAANIVGNVLAGKLLAEHPVETLRRTPAALAATFIFMAFCGGSAAAAVLAVALFGVLTGLSSNNSQYLISEASSDAPEFGNGLFLSCANTGTAAATAFCGLFIDAWGTRASVAGALVVLAASAAAVALCTRASRGRTPLGRPSAEADVSRASL